MKARMPAGFGRPDMNALMRQAQKMQEDMKAKQAELEAAEYTGSASGEMVTVKMNGKHEVLAITIKPEAVDPDDRDAGRSGGCCRQRHRQAGGRDRRGRDGQADRRHEHSGSLIRLEGRTWATMLPRWKS